MEHKNKKINETKRIILWAATKKLKWLFLYMDQIYFLSHENMHHLLKTPITLHIISYVKFKYQWYNFQWSFHLFILHKLSITNRGTILFPLRDWRMLNDLDLMVYVNKSFYDNMFKCTPKPFLVTDSNILCYFVSRVSCMSD